MYETIKILEEKNLFKSLVKQGIITIAGHKYIYETYLKEKGIKTTQAVTNTSIETKTTESNVYKIIKK